MATDSSGNSHVVWLIYKDFDFIVQYRKVDSSGTPGATQDLSDTGQDANKPQVATDSSGNSHVVWWRWNGSNLIIQYRKVDSSGSLGPIKNLSATLQNAYDPQVATDSSGNSHVVWLRSNGTNDIVQYVKVDSSGTPGTVVDELSAAGQNAVDPQVATDSSGNSHLVWYRPNGGLDIIQYRHEVTAPSNSIAPSRSGTAEVGNELTCSTGTWGNWPTSYSFQWTRGGLMIWGATNNAYTVSAYDRGGELACYVTATNFAGSTSAATEPFTVPAVSVNPESSPAAGGGTTTDTSSCKTSGKVVSKSLRRALRSRKIRVKFTTNITNKTGVLKVNAHLRADGVGAKLAARQNVTFSGAQTTKSVTMKLRRKAVRQLRKRANKRMKRGQKKVAMKLRVYCFYGGKKTRTSKSQKMSVSKKKARSKKHSRSKSL